MSGNTNLALKFILCLIVPTVHTIQAEIGEINLNYPHFVLQSDPYSDHFTASDILKDVKHFQCILKSVKVWYLVLNSDLSAGRFGLYDQLR